MLDKRDKAGQNRSLNAPTDHESLDRVAGSFYRYLNSFVSLAGFDRPRYMLLATSLSQEFAVIENHVNHLKVGKKRWRRRLKFIKRMLTNMAKVSDTLETYNILNTAEHLVACVLQLNLMLYSLYDSHGQPNLRMDNYDQMVSKYAQLLHKWNFVFYHLKDVPGDLRVMYDAQVAFTRDTIYFLAGHIRDFYAETLAKRLALRPVRCET